jgi:hypothetical protein
LLGLLGAFTFRNALSIPPFDGDNVLALSAAARPDPLSFFTGRSFDYLPIYRPIPYVLTWIQYHLVGLRPAAYFLVNIMIWIGCAGCAYAVTYLLTRFRIAAFLAALLLLLDVRATAALWWIAERQSSLACLFGALALIVALVAHERKWHPGARVAVFLLLLSSALSKEYGLAFSGALLVLGLCSGGESRRIAPVLGAAVVASYLVMRLVFGRGANTSYCEEMSFFIWRVDQPICYSNLGQGERILQYLYHCAATLVGTFFPDLFTSTGGWRPLLLQPQRATDLLATLGSTAVHLSVFALAVIAWTKIPRRTLPLLVLLFLNAGMSFMLYRQRNHLVGLMGLYPAAGVGLAYLIAAAKQNLPVRQALAVLAGLLVLPLGVKPIAFIETLNNFRWTTTSIDPCRWSVDRHRRDIDVGVVRQIKTLYRLPNPGCTQKPGNTDQH